MKKHSTAILAVLSLLAVSCEQNVNEGTVWDDPKFIRITASREAMVERDEKKSFKWALEDTISLYDVNYVEVPIRNNDVGSQIFFSYEWTTKDPGYAVYPRSEDSVFDKGTLTFNIPAEQQVSAIGSFGPMFFVGKVSGNNTAYRLNSMKNVVSQLKISMSDSTATSISIEAIGGESLVGNVTVDCAKLVAGEEDYWTVAEDDMKSSKVKILPSADSEAITVGGCLHAGSYYISILPQTYSQGLRVTVERKDMDPIVRVLGVENGCVANRSEVLEFAGDLDDTLPDEFTLELIFRGKQDDGTFYGIWPFLEKIVSVDETYTFPYKYQVEGNEMTAHFDFFIYGNKSTYTYNKNGLNMTAKNSRITLPAVSDRYLKSVKMDVVNSAAKGFVLVKMDWTTLGSEVPCVAGAPGQITFPTADKVLTEKDTQYYMRYTVGNTYINSITLVYSKTLE